MTRRTCVHMFICTDREYRCEKCGAVFHVGNFSDAPEPGIVNQSGCRSGGCEL